MFWQPNDVGLFKKENEMGSSLHELLQGQKKINDRLAKENPAVVKKEREVSTYINTALIERSVLKTKMAKMSNEEKEDYFAAQKIGKETEKSKEDQTEDEKIASGDNESTDLDLNDL